MTAVRAPTDPPPSSSPSVAARRDVRALVALGAAIVAISLAAIFIRMAQAPGVVVAMWRMVAATVVVLPIAVRGLRRTPLRGANLRRALLAGVLLAGHFATWITSLEFTSVAASVTLVTTTPLWVALLGWFVSRTRPTRGVLVGAAIAILGGALIGIGDAAGGGATVPDPRPLLGDALALVGAVFVAGYMLLGRSVQRAGVGIDAYIGVAYGTAALVLLPLPALLGQAYLGYDAATWGWIALLALVPQLIGHTGINFAISRLDPTAVATTTLLEPVGAALLALAVFGEVPTALSLAGAAVALVGVAVTVRSRPGAR